MRCPGLLCAGRLPLARRTLLLTLGALSVLPLGALPGPGSLRSAPVLSLGLADATAPWIGTHPVATSAINGRTQGCFTVNAYGGSLRYQWQRKDATHDWTDIFEANFYYYRTPVVSLADQGAQFRVVVRNGPGGVSVTSLPAVLTVEYLTITQQPSSQKATPGGTATFRVGVSATPDPTYQWQRRAPGSSSWLAIPSATASSFVTPTLSSADSGAAYRVVMRNRAGVFTSQAATLSVQAQPLSILQGPVNAYAELGKTASFSVVAAGGQGPLQYQWQSCPGSTSQWIDIPDATSATCTLTAQVEHEERLVRVVVSDASGARVESAGVVFSAPVLEILRQPEDQSVPEFGHAFFNFLYTSEPRSASIQWQCKRPGGSWVDIPDAHGTSFNEVVRSTFDLSEYRVLLSNAYKSVVSEVATLRIQVSDSATLDLRFEGLPMGVAPLAYVSSVLTPARQVTGPESVQLKQGACSIAPCAIWGTGAHAGKVFQASPVEEIQLVRNATQAYTVRYTEVDSWTVNLPTGDPANPHPMSFVWIPAGAFTMGRGKVGDFTSWAPAHDVTLSRGFWMSRTELTNRQARLIAGMGSELPEDQEKPVTHVTWENAQEICARLGALGQTPAGCTAFRLPSEAEWEYATRAGSTTVTPFGNDPDLGPCFAFGLVPTTPRGPQQVGLLAPNPWGLYDMQGNVHEMCQDRYHENYEGAPTDGSAWGEPSADMNFLVIRGGDWVASVADADATGPMASHHRRCVEPNQFPYPGLRIVIQ